MSGRRTCTKRCFTSVSKIKEHLKRLRSKSGAQGFRARTYFCKECAAYHLTNHEKGGRTSSGRSIKRQKVRRADTRRDRRAASKRIQFDDQQGWRASA